MSKVEQEAKIAELQRRLSGYQNGKPPADALEDCKLTGLYS